MKIFDKLPSCAGYTTICAFNPETNEVSHLVSQRNQIMDSAASVIAHLLQGNHSQHITTAYFEFENLPTPGSTPTPPVFTKADGVEYYTGLEFSSTNDFIRVPAFSQHTITVNGAGNPVVTFCAITPGNDVGFWGKPFTSENNSAVIGAALVATPRYSTQANDIIFARNYPVGAKVLKPVGEQIALTWSIEVKLPEAD
jgi:hypothetical protein